MKKYMPLEGLRWSRDSGSTLCDTPQNGRSRTGWGGRHRLAHPLVIHIITPLQGSNIELRFAANYNLPLCVIGHFKLFSYRCSNICIFCHQAKS